MTDQTAPTLGARPPEHRVRLIAAAVIAVVLVVSVLSAAWVRSDDGGDPVAAGTAPSTAPRRPTTTASPTNSAPTTTPPTTTTTTAPPGPAALTLAFAGDLLPHMPVNAQAASYAAGGAPYDYRPMLDPMKPILEPVDIAICHMEVPVSPDQGALTGYPSFGTASELVDGAKAAGYDGCSTASNHSLDRGRDGIAATLDRFDQQGMHHAGTARSADEGAAVTLYEVDGAQVAHLSYAYDFNGYQIPADAPFAVNQIDPGRIRADAQRARAAGADLVVVSLHWGTEYQHEPSTYQRDVVALTLPSPDIDLVIGHHAHVVQPIEQVGETYVVWGLGNQLANQPEVPRSDGLTVVVTAEQRPDGRYTVAGIEAVPTWIEPDSFRVLPVVRTLDDPAISGNLRDQLTASYLRTAAVLATAPTPGVTLAPRP